MSECVYFIRAFYTGKVRKHSFGFINWKIGRTYNIERRTKTFQTACPVPLEVVGTLACPDRVHAVRVERDLHEYFAESRITGEWFSFDYYQSRLIYALIAAWPIGNSLRDFADCLPRQKLSSDEALRGIKTINTNQLVPLGTLLDERKQWKQRINELQQSAPNSELVAQLRSQIQNLKADNQYMATKAGDALNYLTTKYNSLISSFKGHSV